MTHDQIIQLVNVRLNQVLRVAESSLAATQYRAFRRVVLDEFGRKGFGRDLARLLGNQQDNNK